MKRPARDDHRADRRGRVRDRALADEERFRGGVHPIGDVLQRYLQARGLAVSPREARIFRIWKEVVGDSMAPHARAVRYDANARRRELVIEVRTSAHLQELRGFTGEEYRRRLNQRLGGESVDSLIFRLKK